jgi:hypothetical protein
VCAVEVEDTVNVDEKKLIRSWTPLFSRFYLFESKLRTKFLIIVILVHAYTCLN